MSDQYSALYESFRWHVPRGFNLAQACCLKWASLPSHERRPALIHQRANGEQAQINFKDLAALSAQLANGLSRLGAIPGDRVAIIMGSSPIETVALMMACWAMQAIAVPLSPELPADTLLSRLRQARCQIAFLDEHAQPQALEAISRCPRIQQTVGLDVIAGNVMGWRGLIARQPPNFVTASTTPSDPALMIWPAHTPTHFPEHTALLLPHQALVGNLTGFVSANRWFPDDATRLLTTLQPWQEAGLLGAILPALYFGLTVVLDESDALNALNTASHVVSTLARLSDWYKRPDGQTEALSSPGLKSVCVLGKSLTTEWRESLQTRLGVAPSLALFVSGCGLICAENEARWPSAPDACGRPVPGHQVSVKQSGQSDGTAPGQLGICRVDSHGHTDPSQYVQIWLQKEAVEGSPPVEIPEWYLPGLAAVDTGDGAIAILGRPDDLIMIDQHRVSPGKIEQALMQQADVARALVMASPLKKPNQPTRELWALVKPSNTADHQNPDWQAQISAQLTGLILRTLALEPHGIVIKLGLVATLPCDDLGSPIRQVWSSRNRIAEIRFIAPNP